VGAPVTAARLAWTLWAAFVALIGLTLWQIARGTGDDDEAFALLLAGYATVGALIAARRPRNAVGWLLLAIAITFGAQAFGETYVGDPDNPGRAAIGWTATCLWHVWFALTGIFLPLVFPDGRLPSPRWRWVAHLGVAAVALSAAGAAFKPGDLGLSARVENPLGVGGDVAAAAEVGGTALAAAGFVLAAASLAVRFRRSRGRERQQLKWFALVGLLIGAMLVLALVGLVAPRGAGEAIGAVGWFSFLALTVVGVPAATGIAILRHRLYDIDLVIRRTLVYGALTATLGGAYAGSVLLLGLALAESDVAVAGATLTVAALFRPARGRIQALVDRRFYRARYDAQRTLDAFAARLRDEVDLDALGRDLRAVARETVAPRSVSLWLRSPR